jgi:2-hydroxyisobutanoyl-CoA mutase large subunit
VALRRQSGENALIGVNRMVESDSEPEIEVHAYDPTTAERQIARTRRVRAERDEAKIRQLLDKLTAVAKDESENIMPVTIELVRNGATMGDIVETLKTVWGTYRETPVF